MSQALSGVRNRFHEWAAPCLHSPLPDLQPYRTILTQDQICFRNVMGRSGSGNAKHNHSRSGPNMSNMDMGFAQAGAFIAPRASQSTRSPLSGLAAEQAQLEAVYTTVFRREAASVFFGIPVFSAAECTLIICCSFRI